MAGKEHIGRYEILEELGYGGMARVYRAYDPNFRRDVALKLMSVRLLDNEAFRQRFDREVHTIASLEHRAIVPVYDYGEEDGRPYLVMRLMTGGSLADRLKIGALPPGDIRRVLDRIGDALDKAHSQGIIHRDLKPGNILFDDDHQPYLSDFGIVKDAGSTRLTATGGMIGTPTYMSPEQVMGKRDIDGRSDIYALGVVLYEMLTGRQPYDAQTGMGLAMAHVTQPVPQLRDVAPHLPAGYQAIIDRAMAKEPEQRYQRGREMAAAFRNPPSSYTSDSTVIEGMAGATVIEKPVINKPETTIPSTTEPSAPPPTAPDKGGLPWKIIAPALLLLLVLFGAYMMRDMFLPDGEPPPPTADPALAALAATVTTQAQEIAQAAIAETAEAAVRETIASETLAAQDLTGEQEGGFDVVPPGTEEGQEPDTAEEPESAEDQASAPEVLPSKTLLPAATVTASLVPADTPTNVPTNTPMPTPTATATLQPDLGPEWIRIGSTFDGDPIEVVRFGAGPNEIVLVGGLHAGFAPATVEIGENLVRHFSQNLHEIPSAVTLYVIPIVNKDSIRDPGEWVGRANGNDVDLNRNWDCNWTRDATWRGAKIDDSGGSGPFSEPETRALRDFFLSIDPQLVIFWEALFRGGLVSPGQCSRANDTTRTSFAEAGVYGGASGYPVANYELEADQVINGDANNWLDTVGIPSFAVLLNDYEDPDWARTLEGVRAVLAFHGD